MGNSYPILEKEAIDYLCGLIRNITNITDSLDDLHVRTDGTFSSHKIDTLLQIILNEANEYTDQITSALVRITAEEMTEEPTLDNTTDKINTLIIYSPTGDTNYNQYLRLENKLIDFGPAEINMSNVYTKEQANAKFALVTDIEGIIDAIGSENMGTVATTLKGAIKEIKDEIDNVNFDDLVEKSSIVTTLDDTVTDEQIPSVKLVKEKLDEVFQSSNDAQNEYETAIIGKGGTVSKVGSVATKNEIIQGIKSIPNDYLQYIIKDGIVQDGYALLYNAAFGTPIFESGYINTNGCRSVGFDNIDTTGYNFLCCKLIYPKSIPSQAGYFLSETTSVSKNSSVTVKYSTVLNISEHDVVNLGWAQGTSGAGYEAYIYDMWLE